LTVFGRRWPSFQVLGCLGAALGIAVAALLAYTRGLSLSVVAVLSGTAVMAAVVLHGLTWWMAGTRRLVYYRYQIAILIAVTGALWLLGEPVITYLDVAILGLGAFLVAGRLGCFMVGCCHGMPHHIGVSYGASHVRAGFAQHFEHVPLFPIQLIESAWVLAIVVAGAIAFALGSAPGWVCSAWLILYGFGRFHLELVRGDPEWPYVAGFSEAQWISLALMLTAIVAGVCGVAPLRSWHIALVVMLGLEMLATTGIRATRGTGSHLLSHPRHLDQLAVLLFDLGAARAAEPGGMLVGTTSLGVRLSMAMAMAMAMTMAMARGEGDDDRAQLFTLSRDGSALPEGDARTLAMWLARLGGFSGQPSLYVRDSGVVHVVFPAQRAAGVRASPAPAIADAGPSAIAGSSTIADAGLRALPSARPAARFHFGQISILPEPATGDATTAPAAGDRGRSVV
jgi:hypothetical protein